MYAAIMTRTPHSLRYYRAEAQAAAKKLLQLEKERDKYSIEAGEANARYLQVCNSGWQQACRILSQLTTACSVKFKRSDCPAQLSQAQCRWHSSCTADGADPPACN